MLVTHDSFAIPAGGEGRVRAGERPELTILQGGDAGEMVNRALLTKGNPQGDVLFGIDNNLLSRALDAGLFEAYTPDGLDGVDDRYRARSGEPRDAGRPRRRLPRRRQGLVRLPRDRAAGRPRRPDATAVPEAARRREPRHLDPGAGVPARHRRPFRPEPAGRTTGAACARTTCSSSTAGRRPTRRASRVPPAARASGRSSSPTRPSPPAEVMFSKKHLDRGADRRRPRQLLPPGRARRRARRREEPEGRPRADRLHAHAALPGGDAREHVRAARAGRNAAAGRVPPLRRRSRPGRSSCPRPRSAATATAGSTSGHRPFCAESRRAGSPRSPCRWRSSRSSSRFRSTAILERGLDLGRRALAPGRNGPAALVHDLAGGRIDRAHARRRAAARVGDRAVPVPGPLARPRARARPVRAADGRRRDRVPGAAPRRLRAGPLGDPRRARLLQRRRRDAHRRRRLGDDRSRAAPRPPPCSEPGRCDARAR